MTTSCAAPSLLLVDDQPDMALIVRALGRCAGVEVSHRTGVADGWVALRERAPALLLLDMRLGSEESGADLCRRLRAAPDLAQLPVALFTTLSQSADVCAGFAAGADLLFDKDLVVQPDEWRQRLVEILAWRRGEVWEKLVAWNTVSAWPAPPAGWLAVYNQALRQALVRRISTDLLRELLQRALRETNARQEDARCWLHAEEAAFIDEGWASLASPETVARLGASLTEQMWCLLGARDSAFFTTALESVVPGLTEAICIR